MLNRRRVERRSADATFSRKTTLNNLTEWGLMCGKTTATGTARECGVQDILRDRTLRQPDAFKWPFVYTTKLVPATELDEACSIRHCRQGSSHIRREYWLHWSVQAVDFSLRQVQKGGTIQTMRGRIDTGDANALVPTCVELHAIQIGIPR